MMTRLQSSSLLLSLLLAAAAPLHAMQADDATLIDVVADVEELSTFQGNCMSLSEAVERARQQTNGQIVSAETRRSGNREVHIVKVLTDGGTVRTLRFPGCGGR